MKDYYYILGIKKNATNEEIRKAYRKLSLKFHPDKNEGDKFFEERFKDINEAYETLIDNEKKNAYDYLSSQKNEKANKATKESSSSNPNTETKQKNYPEAKKHSEPNKLFDTTIGKLRVIGFGEAISWLLLLGFAMPLKYIWHEPIYVKYVGWLHGVLFLSYILFALLVMLKNKWTLLKFFTAFVYALLPFGTIFFDSRLKQEEQNTK